MQFITEEVGARHRQCYLVLHGAGGLFPLAVWLPIKVTHTSGAEPMNDKPCKLGPSWIRAEVRSARAGRVDKWLEQAARVQLRLGPSDANCQ